MTKRKNFYWIVPAFAAISAFSSCSLMKNMDDMHTSTGEMDTKLSTTNDKMAQMESRLASLDSMNKAMTDMLASLGIMVKDMDGVGMTMNQMVATMRNLYGDNRQGTSLAARDQDFFQYLAKNSTDQQEAKLVVAGEYFMAYEDQLWKGTDTDTPEALTELRHEAVQEFLHDVAQFIPVGKNKDTGPSNTSNSAMNTYAIAFSMDMLNPHFAQIAKDSGQEPISMLDLLHQGLSDASLEDSMNPAADDENTADFEVQASSDVAIYLLQVRANFLPAVVLSKVSDINEPCFTGVWAKLKDYLGHWEMNLKDKTPAQVQFLAGIMHKANAERAFLKHLQMKDLSGKRIKTEAPMDSQLMKVIGHMVMPVSLYPPSPAHGATKDEWESYKHHVKILDSLVHEIQIFRGEIEAQ